MRILRSLTLAIGLCTMSAALANDFTLTIARKYSDANCTSGYLAVNSTIQAYTLERPWAGNAPLLSSIPVGTYNGILRYDHRDQWRIELQGVPGRTNVQMHTGNTPDDTEGCIIIGKELDASLCAIKVVPASLPMTHSRQRSTVRQTRCRRLTRLSL